MIHFITIITLKSSMELEKHINKLPPYIDSVIYSFIIPNDYNDIKSIRFDFKYIPEKDWINSIGYNMKYEVAYINNEKIKNKEGQFLSRIPKKNGKHRYYITTETYKLTVYDHNYNNFKNVYYDNEEFKSYYDDYLWYDDSIDECLTYSSKYVGKNIEKALVYLFISD